MSEKLGGISVFFLTHNSLLSIQMVFFGVGVGLGMLPRHEALSVGGLGFA